MVGSKEIKVGLIVSASNREIRIKIECILLKRSFADMWPQMPKVHNRDDIFGKVQPLCPPQSEVLKMFFP